MSELSPLPRVFFNPSARVVAPRLLGHLLIRRTARGLCGGPIVEAEAYLKDDPACHAAPGLTARNRVMFGPPGYGYVYLIYGYHFCVNAVCRPARTAEAVLIRALEANLGLELMQERRPVSRAYHLTNGPAKLCQAMKIERVLDGVDLCDVEAPLFIARNPAVAKFRSERGPMVTTTRVGITPTCPCDFISRGAVLYQSVAPKGRNVKSRIRLWEQRLALDGLTILTLNYTRVFWNSFQHRPLSGN